MDEFNPTVSGGEQADVDLQTGADVGAQGEGQGAEGSAERAPAVPQRVPSSDDADSAGQQQRAFNAAMAAARRRAEKDTEGRVRRQYDEEIAAMRIPNPTKPGSYFASKKDLEDYSGALRQADAERRAQADGRSVEEVLEEDADRAFIRRQRAEEKKALEANREKAERDAFIRDDIADMQSRHPDVDIAALDANTAFRRFAGSRYGKEHLADLYEDYVGVVGSAAAAATVRSQDKADRSTGHGSGGGGGTLTSAQRAALKEWNEDHPEMKMTEKEFLER